MSSCLVHYTNKKHWFAILTAIVICICSFVVGLSIGTVNISPLQLLSVFSGYDEILFRIIMYVRLPRVIAALFVGAALAVSGAILQGVFHNPLAGPNLIGVNSGAGFIVLVVGAMFTPHPALMPMFAFLGAMLASLIVMVIMITTNASRLSIVLIGFAVSSIFAAGMNTILILFPQAFVGASTFIVGGFSSITLQSIIFPAVYICIGLVISMLLAKELNILALGNDTAKSLGMNVKFTNTLLIAISSVLAGAAVSLAGLISFVGLIVPHAVRYIVGNDNKVVIPVSCFVGGAFVVLSDTVARTIFAPFELPVGIIIGFVGAPIFIALILRRYD